ncbi:MAG TPA: response regulator transcription factor [Sphingobium sp.]
MHILVVEDDPELAQFILSGLARAGHEAHHASSGEQAVVDADAHGFDAIILDRMLPGINGLDVLHALRSAGCGVPVLLLTALNGIDDRVAGLDAGADDYVGKPFAMSEIVSRLNAIVRRRSEAAQPQTIERGSLCLDLIKRELRDGGRLVPLQPRELRILEELMRHTGQPVTRAMLLERIWGFHFDPQTSMVETHLSRLRSKLANSGVLATIETVRNVGYRFLPHG